MPAQNIDEVIAALDAIVARARQQQSRLGFFAALYRLVTRRVKEGIAAGRFEDGPRMERLDVIFANRYLQALDDFLHGRQTTACWRLAFERAQAWRPLIVQHLLLGMNAHINLDLGVAAVQTCPDAALSTLQRDFDEINLILTELLEGVQEKLDRLSPWLGWLDRVGGKTDEAIFNFSLQRARAAAWRAAQLLAPLASEEQQKHILELDERVAGLARKIYRPGWLISAAAFVIRLAEEADIEKITAILAEEDLSAPAC